MRADNSPETRRKYVEAFNVTQVKIWKEKIIQLKVVDTANLYNSVVSAGITADGLYTSVSISHRFPLYGLYQDRGTGRETPLGNSGDIGRAKMRERRPWFNPKFWSSFYNIQEFFADSLGEQAARTVAGVFQP